MKIDYLKSLFKTLQIKHKQMKTKILIKYLSILYLAVFHYTPTHGQWINGQAADMVFGQSDFSTGSSGATLNKFDAPFGIAIDPNTKKVFVTDYYVNRISRFNSYTSYVNGAAAEMVITAINGIGSINGPTGIFMDHSGNLWIADTNKNRVVRIPNASNIHNGPNADLILSNFNSPVNIFIRDNTLWISLQGNKILRFNHVDQLQNNSVPDAYLGNSNGSSGTSESTFNFTNQLYVDYADNLWICDSKNNRVLKFPNAKTFVSGAAASLVLGQANFTTGLLQSTSQSSLGAPMGIYGDGIGNLYISQYNNNRIFVYKNAASITNNNAPADFVIGQPDFTSNIVGTSSVLIKKPMFLYIDSFFWVADQGNSRVLRYSPLTVLPVALKTYEAKLAINGNIELNWQTSNETNNSHFNIQISNDGKNFNTVATISSKAINGNSSEPINYNFNMALNHTALAGFSLLILFFLPAIKNRMMKVAITVLCITAIAACTKDSSTTNEQTLYLKLLQVDKDGTTTELGIKTVKIKQ